MINGGGGGFNNDDFCYSIFNMLIHALITYYVNMLSTASCSVIPWQKHFSHMIEAYNDMEVFVNIHFGELLRHEHNVLD